MSSLREAATLALEALERGETKLRYAAITALKAALAEPQEPVQEPVMYQWQRSETGRASVVGPFWGPMYLSSTQPEPEERSFCTRCGKRLHAHDIHTCTPPQLWEGEK